VTNDNCTVLQKNLVLILKKNHFCWSSTTVF